MTTISVEDEWTELGRRYQVRSLDNIVLLLDPNDPDESGFRFVVPKYLEGREENYTKEQAEILLNLYQKWSR